MESTITIPLKEYESLNERIFLLLKEKDETKCFTNQDILNLKELQEKDAKINDLYKNIDNLIKDVDKKESEICKVSKMSTSEFKAWKKIKQQEERPLLFGHRRLYPWF